MHFCQIFSQNFPSSHWLSFMHSEGGGVLIVVGGELVVTVGGVSTHVWHV